MTVKHVIVLMELCTIAWRVCNSTGVWAIPPRTLSCPEICGPSGQTITEIQQRQFGKQSWYVKLPSDRSHCKKPCTLNCMCTGKNGSSRESGQANA